MKRRFYKGLLMGACAFGFLVGCGDDQERQIITTGNSEPNNGGTNSTTPSLQLEECGSDDNPTGVEPPAEDVEVDMMRFELESESIRTVEGQLIDATDIGSPRAIEKAFLVGTGSFLHEGCIVRQSGASYSWEGAACQLEEGTLINVLTVSGESAQFDDALAQATVDSNLRFQGYEVGRLIDVSPGGGFWMDGGDDGAQGQTTLWLTNICTLP